MLVQSSTSWHPSPYLPPDSAKLSEPLPQSLARAAALWPDRGAVLHGEECFSFADLWKRIAGLAQEIEATAAAPGPIALIQSVGLDTVAAWFACALARRPFLLLEPGHPPARQAELISAAGVTLILCDHATIGNLPDDLPIPRLVSDGRRVATHHGEMLGADEPAMIFPTSGSTGKPKLVVYSSRTLQAKVQVSISLMRVPSGARVLVAGSHGNYGFLHHALVFLLSGGALCLANVKADGFSGLLDAIDRLGARHVRFTPSMFRTFAPLPEARDVLNRLEAVRFSGEPLLASDLDLARSVLKPDCLIQNVYGSTESALFIWSDGDETDALSATVPIGQVYPLSSYALRQLQDAEHEAGTGELLIRSAFHAIGDLRDGAINAHRFPFDPRSLPDRVYETGDIVRQLPGGSLVLLGRMNRMVKVRGQKVFLPEVENHLRAMPGVTGAAVVERKQADGIELFGFITAQNEESANREARSWLASRLPDYMLPRQIVRVAQIPLLEGGKVDYRALLAKLPDPVASVTAKAQDDVARGGDYGRLARMWQSTLGWGAEDASNSFFALGGDSLKLMELGLAVERDFGRRLPVEEFVADATLAGLAKLLGIVPSGGAKSLTKGLRIRFAHPAGGKSKGIALAMPGFRGSALVASFLKAGFFPDYDTWAADDPVEAGNMIEDRRWLRSTLQIAERLREGAAPAPKVIFGASVGGSIAWLVGRLLTGTPQCPELVVMVDSAPLHHMRSYCTAELRRALASAHAGNPPPVLHIRRAPLDSIGLEAASERLWWPEDNIEFSLELPTIDHQDLLRAEVLALAAGFVSDALSDPSRAPASSLATDAIPTVGGRIHHLLTRNGTYRKAELGALVEQLPELAGQELALAICYIILRHEGAPEARAYLEESISRAPASRLLRYAMRRLRRRPEALCRGRLPAVGFSKQIEQFRASAMVVEKALLARQEVHSTGPWSGFNRIGQFSDALAAALDARFIR